MDAISVSNNQFDSDSAVAERNNIAHEALLSVMEYVGNDIDDDVNVEIEPEITERDLISAEAVKAVVNYERRVVRFGELRAKILEDCRLKCIAIESENSAKWQQKFNEIKAKFRKEWCDQFNELEAKNLQQACDELHASKHEEWKQIYTELKAKKNTDLRLQLESFKTGLSAEIYKKCVESLAEE